MNRRIRYVFRSTIPANPISSRRSGDGVEPDHSSPPSSSNWRPVAAMNAPSRVSAPWAALSASAVSRQMSDALVQDPDPVGQRLGLGHVVGAEQDRRVVLLADRADELLHLELRARVEAGRRLVEQEQDGRREERAGERDLLLHPARQVLHRLAAPLGREPDPLEDARDRLARLARGHPVEAGGVAQVLGRRHALEERRLDRHAVHQPLYGARAPEDVVSEHGRRPAVVEEQRREEAHERRLPRAVLPQDGDALAPPEREASRRGGRPRGGGAGDGGCRRCRHGG